MGRQASKLTNSDHERGFPQTVVAGPNQRRKRANAKDLSFTDAAYPGFPHAFVRQ